MPKAYTPTDVVLGEAVSGSPRQRYRDMLGIASAIANRAALLGVSFDDVVSNQREFNAYGKSLPPGSTKYRGLAEQALRQVQETGPVHAGTFYATPRATGNLPKGLAPVDVTKGHVFFSDPYARAIGTAQGYKKPSMDAQQQLAGLAGKSIPTPMSRPSTGLQAAPVASVERGLLGEIGNSASVPQSGLLAASDRAPTGAPAFDPGRFAGPSVANFDAGRFGPAPMANAGLLATTGRAVQGPAVAQSFDPGRFGVPEKIANSSSMLASMLDRQRETALPKIDSEEALAMGAQPAATPGYVDPMVTTSFRATQAVAPAVPAAQPETYTPQPSAYVAQPATPPAVAAINTASPAVQKRTIDQRIGGLLGVLAPAAIGGILAGPLGALAGGFLGKQMTDPRNQYPSKPTKGSGPKAPSMSKGEIDAMHDRASKSPQAQKAWGNGSAGLF